MTPNWCTSFCVAARRLNGQGIGDAKVHLGAVASLAWHMSGTWHAWQVHNIDGQCQLKVVPHLLRCLSGTKIGLRDEKEE